MLIVAVDPLPLITEVTASAHVTDRPRDVYVEHGTDAKIEYLIGLAISAPARSTQPCTAAVIQSVIDGVDDIFDIEEAVLVARLQSGTLTREQFLLQQERLLNRFQGYEEHIVTVLAEVFKPIAEVCQQVLGWSPTDLPVLVDGIRSRAESKLHTLRTYLGRQRGQPATVTPTFLAFTDELARLSMELYVHSPEEIAEACHLSPHVVRVALSMSVKLAISPTTVFQPRKTAFAAIR